MAVFEIN